MSVTEWECSEWQNLSEGQKAIFVAFFAPKVNNIPQIPEENTFIVAGEDYTPKNEDVVVFINVDGTLNERPDPNEMIRYTPQQRDAIKLWLTEYYGNGSDEESVDEWSGSSEDDEWDEGYGSDWGQMDDEW